LAESRARARQIGQRLFRRGTRSVRRTLSERSRILAYLAILGPGVIAANAGNDAGGIATYAQTGADYGFRLLWTFIPLTIGLALVQEMCARMGAATGKGLSDLIREQFGVRWTFLVMLALLIANGAITVSEFAGIGAATEILHVPRFVAVPLAAGLIWWLVVKGSYKRVERVFLLMSLVFFGYFIAAFLAKPDWSQVGHGFTHPTFSMEAGYLFTVVAIIGTTISPYMQVFVQSSVVEKGIRIEDYAMTRADVIVGTVFAMGTAMFIVVSTSATLHKLGIHITSAADAAQALQPLAGPYAALLFAVGLFGASMLAAGVLPLATAYSISEALGFEKGVSRTFREAPIFVGIFTFLIVAGAAVAMIPGLPLFRVLIVTQVINGLLLPVILISILRLVNNRELMGDHVNGPVFNIIAVITVVIVSALSLLLLLATIAPGLFPH
jgi:NRAMP (natural resistance-associated macrophage protein)-like metal ion transporter